MLLHIWVKFKNNAIDILGEMLTILKQGNYQTKLIVAAIKNQQHIIDSAKLGAHAITLSANIFNEFIDNQEETIASIDKFNQDWVASNKTLMN